MDKLAIMDKEINRKFNEEREELSLAPRNVTYAQWKAVPSLCISVFLTAGLSLCNWPECLPDLSEGLPLFPAELQQPAEIPLTRSRESFRTKPKNPSLTFVHVQS